MSSGDTGGVAKVFFFFFLFPFFMVWYVEVMLGTELSAYEEEDTCVSAKRNCLLSPSATRSTLSHTHTTHTQHPPLHFTTGDRAVSNSQTAYYRHLQRGALPEDPLSRVQMPKNTVLSPSPVAAPPAAEVYIYVCVYIYVHTHTHTHTHTPPAAEVYIYVYVCIYMYTHTHTQTHTHTHTHIGTFAAWRASRRSRMLR